MANAIKVIGYSMTIPTPMRELRFIPENMSAGKAEQFFIKKRDSDIPNYLKNEYERARAICKYIYTCGGELKSIRHSDAISIEITASFRNLEDMNSFNNTWHEAIKGAMIKF